MEWKTLILPVVAVLIIAGVYYAGVATSGNISSASTAITAVEVAFGIVGFIVVIGGLIYGSKELGGPNSFQYASIFAMYLPVTYVLIGIISDIVSQEYKASASSVTAIGAVVLNKLISMLFAYFGSTTQKIQEEISNNGDIKTLYTRVYQGCTVPGFENMESIVAPQSLVIIVSLFMFFALEIGVNHPGQSLSGIVWIAITAFIIQLAFINTNGCLTGEYYWNGSLVVAIVMSLLIGGLAGGLGWTANHFMFPTAPGSAASGGHGGGLGSSGPAVGPSGSILPQVGGPTNGSSGSDNDQFVCEAYKNGELITSTIAE
jgi:hypothetical protein